MTTFYQGLLAHYAKLADNTLLVASLMKPTLVEVAHAVYADTSGLDIDLLVPGAVHMLALVDAGLTIGSFEYSLRRCLPDGVHVMQARSFTSDDDMNEALSLTAPLLLWKDTPSFKDSKLADMAQKTWPCEVNADFLGALILRLWPDQSPTVPDFTDDEVDNLMTFSMVLIALRASTSALEFFARVFPPDDVTEPDRDDDVAVAKETAPNIIDTSTRPLSEMTGFGDAKDWGLRLARDLTLYRDGKIAWADVDKGLLLSSPPGGGKTTFAKSLALECECQLVITGYAEIQNADSGSAGGDSAARSLVKMFKKWRQYAEAGPLILFYDEIDTMGVRGGRGVNNGWFASQINAWLAFLDGAEGRTNIIVVGATNHPDQVDSALRRPGRLDRHIEIPAPSSTDIVGMIAFHAGVGDIDPDFARMVRALKGKTPADIMLAGRDARRRAREEDRSPTALDVIASLPAPEMQLTPAEWHLASVHEAGHAVVAMAVGQVVESVDMSKLLTLSIHPGNILLAPFLATGAIHFGGIAAEQVLLGGFGGGGAADLQQATVVVRRYLYQMGHGSLAHYGLDAPVTFAQEKRIEEELRKMFDRSVAIVKANRSRVLKVAAALRRDHFLDGAEIAKIAAFNRAAFFSRKDEDVDPYPHPWQDAA